MHKRQGKWKQFRQRSAQDKFWACVNSDGVWFDSASSVELAMHWCRMDSGDYGAEDMSDAEWMDKIGHGLGYNIISEKFLKVLWQNKMVS
jgi:hypothetical protein